MLFASLALDRLKESFGSFLPQNNRTLNTSPSNTANAPTATRTLESPNNMTPIQTVGDFSKDIASKAQAFIDKYRMKNDLPALITGEDVAKASSQFNIDPKLILAQGLNETHFGTNPAAKRALKYNSAFGMGSFDDGSQRMTFANGTDATLQYAKLLRTQYLGDKDSLPLLDNYVNLKGQRYASDKSYETKLKSTIEKVKKFGL